MRRADARVPSSAERVLKIGGISALVAPGGGFNPVHGRGKQHWFHLKSCASEYSTLAQPGPCDGAVLLDDRLCVSRGPVLVMAVAEEDPKIRSHRGAFFFFLPIVRADFTMEFHSTNYVSSCHTTLNTIYAPVWESLCSQGRKQEVGGACSRAVCGCVWRRAGRQSIWLEKSWQPCWVRQVCEWCVSALRGAEGCHMLTSSPCPVCRTRW
jgi:hypothetical protein